MMLLLESFLWIEQWSMQKNEHIIYDTHCPSNKLNGFEAGKAVELYLLFYF